MMHCWACQAQGERSVSPPRRRAKPGQRSERKSCRRTSSGSPVFSSLGIVFSSDTNTVARASRIENASSQRKGQSWRGKKKKKKKKEIPEKDSPTCSLFCLLVSPPLPRAAANAALPPNPALSSPANPPTAVVVPPNPLQQASTCRSLSAALSIPLKLASQTGHSASEAPSLSRQARR